ncbi:unnamed protein product [Adineta steineri]|uniref:Uncharacterized protein n=1 Tax=Adineta steineri TaxID=433720 RepID=A0A818G1B8_9BILA|nr:unnamed protein product [Adineta steineri]
MKHHNENSISNSKKIRIDPLTIKDNTQSKRLYFEDLPVELFIYYLFPYLQQHEIIQIFFNLNYSFQQIVISYFDRNKNIDLRQISQSWLLKYLPNLLSKATIMNINDKQIENIFQSSSSLSKLQSLFITNIKHLPSAKFLKHLKSLKQLKYLHLSENKNEYKLYINAYVDFNMLASLFEEDSLLESFILIRTLPLSLTNNYFNTMNCCLQNLTIDLLHLTDLTRLLTSFPSLKSFYVKIANGEYYINENRPNFLLPKLVQCHFECKFITQSDLNYFLDQLKQSTLLQTFKLKINDTEKLYDNDEIVKKLSNFKNIHFYIQFHELDFQHEIIQNAFNNHRLLWYKTDYPNYYSCLSLPYSFKELLNVSNNIVDHNRNDQKDILLFPTVEHIEISYKENQLSPKLIQFINNQFPNLFTIEIRLYNLHEELMNDKNLILNKVRKLIINYTNERSYYDIKRLLLLTSNIEILIIDYINFITHKRKLSHDGELITICRQIKILIITDCTDGLDSDEEDYIRNKIFKNLEKLVVQ